MITIDFGSTGALPINLAGIADEYVGAIAEYLEELLGVDGVEQLRGRLTNFRHAGGRHVVVRVPCDRAEIMPFATLVESEFRDGAVWVLPRRVRDLHNPQPSRFKRL